MPKDKINMLHNLNIWFDCLFSTYNSLKKKYPKISGYLDKISKIWIMKKFDTQSIHVSKENGYPCIQVSMYPSMHDIQVSKKKSVSKISMYPDIWKKWYPLIPTWGSFWQKHSLLHTIQKLKKMAGQNALQILLLDDANMIGEH